MPQLAPLASQPLSTLHPLPPIVLKQLDEEGLVDKYPGPNAPILSKVLEMETTGLKAIMIIAIELSEVQSYDGGNVTVH